MAEVQSDKELESLSDKEFDMELESYLRKYIIEQMYITDQTMQGSGQEKKYHSFSRKLNENPSFASVVASYISLRLQQESSKHSLRVSMASVTASIVALGITISQRLFP